MNKMIKTMLLAGVMLAPVAVTAKAADIDVPAADPAMMGLYLRADAGWSWLNWSGGADDEHSSLAVASAIVSRRTCVQT